jgi:hypothetical protein
MKAAVFVRAGKIELQERPTTATRFPAALRKNNSLPLAISARASPGLTVSVGDSRSGRHIDLRGG